MRRIAAALWWLLLVVTAAADSIRVTTWNLQWFPSGSPKAASAEVEAKRIREAARIVRVINPDVLLLQEVRNMTACQALTDALLPAKYHLLVSSAFQDPMGGGVAQQQVAILAKNPADAAWSETWKKTGTVDPPRGFAFAIVPFQKRRIGFYSVHLKSNLTKGDQEREHQINILKRETSADQILAHRKLMLKDHGALAGFVIGGDFNTNPDDPEFVSERTLRTLEAARFKNPILGLPRANRVTWPSDGRFPDATFDYLFARGVAPVGAAEILPADFSDHRPVTLELRVR